MIKPTDTNTKDKRSAAKKEARKVKPQPAAAPANGAKTVPAPNKK